MGPQLVVHRKRFLLLCLMSREELDGFNLCASRIVDFVSHDVTI